MKEIHGWRESNKEIGEITKVSPDRGNNNSPQRINHKNYIKIENVGEKEGNHS